MATTVCITQPVLKQYRVPFFDRLHTALGRHCVSLRVVYSAPFGAEATKRDNATLAASYGREVTARRIGKAVWQSAWSDVTSADLTIVEDASKQLVNYPLLLLSRIGRKRLAFWGHGRNRQSSERALGERLKRRTLRLADWWFAYTDGTARYLAANGMDAARITTVQNSIDVTALGAAVVAVSDGEVTELRCRLGISSTAPLGLYCGALYRGKKLDLLLAAAERVRAFVPDFSLAIIGAGSELPVVEAAAARLPWCHYLGPLFGSDKAKWLRVADVVLNPGVVGAVVLDAFAAALPLVTTDLPGHGPEIEYLEAGRAGIVTAPNDQAFATGVIELLTDGAKRAELRAAAAAAAQRYTLDAMVERFTDGVLRSLA